MLPSITKRFCDRSTDSEFAFSFFCDSCGTAWESERYPFSLRETPPLSEAEQKAHKILWAAEHNAAYERANNEAILHFNRCPRCGRRVCDNCFAALDDVCKTCRNENK